MDKIFVDVLDLKPRRSHVDSEWLFSYSLSKIDFTLRGHSRSRERTGFYIPELNILLDAGVPSPYSPIAVLITHCHADHSVSVVQAVTNITTNPIICVPKKHRQLFNNLIQAKEQLTEGDPNRVLENYELRGVEAGDVIDIEVKKSNYRISIFQCYHSVESVGYIISKHKQKLKSQYQNLDKKEIVEIKKQGVTITEPFIDPLLAYVGDTNITVFEKNPYVFHCKYIIVECTFLFKEHSELADINDHICWEGIIPIVKKHPKVEFILIHFSLRYNDIDIIKFFQHELDKHKINNVYPWLN